MWFDVAAALAEIQGQPPAISATIATDPANVADVAIVAGRQDRNPAPKAGPASQASREPQASGSLAVAPALAREVLKERAAILEHEGGFSRQEAERLASAQTGIEDDAGSTPAEPMRSSDASPQAPCQAPCQAPEPTLRPFAKPATPEDDARTLLAFLAREGPMSFGVAARTLGWGATRAWQAGAHLEAAGRIRHDHLGRMVPFPAEATP